VLRRARTAQGRTLQDVATDARISIAYLSEIERGRKEASSEVLLAVCRALGMRVVDLLAEVTSELLAAELAADLRRRASSPTAAGEPARPGAPRAERYRVPGVQWSASAVRTLTSRRPDREGDADPRVVDLTEPDHAGARHDGPGPTASGVDLSVGRGPVVAVRAVA